MDTYTFTVEIADDEQSLTGQAFTVTIFSGDKQIGDGVAGNLSDAIREGLREAGLYSC